MNNASSKLSLITHYLKQALVIRKSSGPINLNIIIRDLGSYDQVTFHCDLLSFVVSHLESCDINDDMLDAFHRNSEMGP